MDRIVEKERAGDVALRKLAKGKVFRSDAKQLTDAFLLAKLASFGISLERSSLERLCARALSAEEIVKPLLDRPSFRGKDTLESDWIWICVSALWERWFPDEPCFELLDDKMYSGYQLLASKRGATSACRVWLEAWNDVLRLFDKGGMRSIKEFDEKFRGSQFLFNWIQDLQDELWNAGLDDREFLTARIALCEEGLRRFSDDDELTTQNRRRALADTYFELGERATGEALYREWLRLDPAWGWGWVGWADCYRFTRREAKDPGRSEQLLREGLAVADVRDRDEILERMVEVCEEQGRHAEAEEFQRQAEHGRASTKRGSTLSSTGTALRLRTDFEMGDEGAPLNEWSDLKGRLGGSSMPVVAKTKVGRNEPCPCGSGKKFKKCCGGS